MSDRKPWPKFKDEEPPRCFRCGEKLVLVRDSGYPAGYGARVGKCGHCALRTWFDTIEDRPAQ